MHLQLCCIGFDQVFDPFYHVNFTLMLSCLFIQFIKDLFYFRVLTHGNTCLKL